MSYFKLSYFLQYKIKRCAIILIDIGLVSVTTPVIPLLLYLVILFLIFVNKLVLQTQQNTLLKTIVLIYYSMRYD